MDLVTQRINSRAHQLRYRSTSETHQPTTNVHIKQLPITKFNGKKKHIRHPLLNQLCMTSGRILMIVLLLVLLFVAIITKRHFFLALGFKLQDLVQDNTVLTGCRMRNHPFIELLGDSSIVIAWEQTCELSSTQRVWLIPNLSGKVCTLTLSDDTRIGQHVLDFAPMVGKSFYTTQVDVRRFRIELALNLTEFVSAGNIMTNLFDVCVYVGHVSEEKGHNIQDQNERGQYFMRDITRIQSVNRVMFPRLVEQSLTAKITETPGGQSELRVAIFGDNHSETEILNSLLSITAPLKAGLLVHMGDSIQNKQKGGRDWQTQFFAPLEWYGLLSTTPILHSPGNHDGFLTHVSSQSCEGTGCASTTTLHQWAAGASYAAGAGAAAASHPQLKINHRGARAVSWGGRAIRFIVLNSFVDKPDTNEQITFLQQEMRSEAYRSALFRVVVVHVPPYLEYWDKRAWTKGRQSLWGGIVKTKFAPLFEKYEVDLVLSGHEHRYQRGTKNGVKYVISGGAGGGLDLERVEDYGMYIADSPRHHFCMLKVNADRVLQFEALDANGEVFDRFELKSLVE